MAVEEWGSKTRRPSEFGIAQNPAYGLDLRTSRAEFKKRASVMGARAVKITQRTAKAFQNRPYQTVAVALSLLNILLLFAASTQLPWYYQELHVNSRVQRTTMTWDRLLTCDSASSNQRTTNTSREVCAVVFLGDIRLDQDYLRAAGWSAFACNLVALLVLVVAAYATYLARVDRRHGVPSPFRLCLSRQYSPAVMHGAASVLLVSGFGSFSSIMLGNLPSDPTSLNPSFATGANDAARFGSAYGLSVTAFLFELVCIGLMSFCSQEVSRNVDASDDDPALAAARGSEAAADFDEVYGGGGVGRANETQSSVAPKPAANGVDSRFAIEVDDDDDDDSSHAHTTTSSSSGGVSHPAPARTPSSSSGSGPVARPGVQAVTVPPGPPQPPKPAVPPRRSFAGPAVRASVAAASDAGGMSDAQTSALMQAADEAVAVAGAVPPATAARALNAAGQAAATLPDSAATVSASSVPSSVAAGNPFAIE